MTGSAAPHRQCCPSASLVIGRQRRRLPRRDENAPIRVAAARSVSAPTLFGRRDDAQRSAEILRQRHQHGLPIHDHRNAEIPIAFGSRVLSQTSRGFFPWRLSNASPRTRGRASDGPASETLHSFGHPISLDRTIANLPSPIRSRLPQQPQVHRLANIRAGQQPFTCNRTGGVSHRCSAKLRGRYFSRINTP
jgi:hypothetical protein